MFLSRGDGPVFQSSIREVGSLTLPSFSGVRIQAMPVRIGDINSLPDEIGHYGETFLRLSEMGRFEEEIGYLTIDERFVQPGRSHRRPGIHTDFFKRIEADCFTKTRPIRPIDMVMVSDVIGCRGWDQSFSEYPADDGDCSHLSDELDPASEVTFHPGIVYGLNRLSVHESVVLANGGQRTFVRLLGDILVEHYTNYTQNPTGVCPPSDVFTQGLRRADYMSH